MQPRHQATLTQPFQCDLQPQLQETHKTTHTGTTTCCRTQRRNQTTAAAPAADTRYLSSPAAATLHGKTQGFVLRLPPHNTEHATFMQPFQCDLQPQLQETHRTTHTGTTTRCRTQRRHMEEPNDRSRAPHTRGTFHRRKATLHGKTQGFVLRLPPHNTEHATFMQPFQCDLQPQLQETHRTTHTGTTTCCRTQRRHMEEPNDRSRAPHTRGTFHRRLQPLYTEKYKVSCSGFLPTTQSMQHSCSHSNAICDHSFKKRIELRTQEQPLVAKHIQGTTRTAAAPAAHTRYLSRLQPLYTEKHKVSCSGFLPKTKTIEHSCSHYTTFRSIPFLPHHFPSSPLPTSLRHHFPSSPLSLRHHFPSSPLPFVTTSHHHHFPSSPLPFVTTSHRHHFPWSPLPFLTTSLPHHFPWSPLPIVPTSLRHHFLTTSLRHHPVSWLLILTTSLHHHFPPPSSPLPFLTTSHRHHFPWSPLPIVTTLCHSFLFFCYVLLDDVPPFIISSLRILFVRNSEVLLPNFL